MNIHRSVRKKLISRIIKPNYLIYKYVYRESTSTNYVDIF